MLRIIQDIKGPIPHRMVRAHIQSYANMSREAMFTDDYKFKYQVLVSDFLPFHVGRGDEDTHRQTHGVHETQRESRGIAV